MSIVYCARNIDYSANNISDTIPITILLDNELTNIYFRYIGKEKIKIRRIGTFNCIKFGVYLVEGSIFHEGENMELWVTDDENKIPVLVKTPILIGAIQARIVGLKGYKYKLTSKIK